MERLEPLLVDVGLRLEVVLCRRDEHPPRGIALRKRGGPDRAGGPPELARQALEVGAVCGRDGSHVTLLVVGWIWPREAAANISGSPDRHRILRARLR
jgi:hypothetical protein